MIKVTVRVQRYNVGLYGQKQALACALCNFENIEWVNYLRSHGVMEEKCMIYGDNAVHDCATVWNLPAKYETFFILKFGHVCYVENV